MIAYWLISVAAIGYLAFRSQRHDNRIHELEELNARLVAKMVTLEAMTNRNAERIEWKPQFFGQQPPAAS